MNASEASCCPPCCIGLRESAATLTRPPDCQTDRRRVTAGTGIELLRAVRDDNDDVLLAAQVDVIAGLGDAVRDGDATIAVHRHVHEEVDVRHDIARTHPYLAERRDEIVAAA